MEYLFKAFDQDSPISQEERQAIAEVDEDEVLHEILCQDDDLLPERAEKMTPKERIDKWLTWEGICGYTDDIIKLVVRVLGLGLTEEEIEAILD